MYVVRNLERRLERLLEGVAGRVFSGRLHPSEIATRLAREADFARFQHENGPATANVYTILIHPRDLATDPSELEQQLTEEIHRHTIEEGLRLEGPCRVTITSSEAVSPGSLVCHVEVVPGPPVVWGRLVAADETLDIGRNHSLIGRSDTADVSLLHDDVSRRHAVITRSAGTNWIRDLSSANGTTVDGQSVGEEPVSFTSGAVIGFGPHRYRFVEA